jgi:predicted PurR-regulated permease PerM
MDSSDRWLPRAVRAAPLVLFLWMVRSLLGVVALGAVCALLVHPLQRRLVRWSPRLTKLSPLLLTVATIFLLVIPFVLVTVQVVASAQEFLAGGLEDVFGHVVTFARQHFSGLAARLHLPSGTLQESASSVLQRTAGFIAGFASAAASSMPELVIDVFLFVASLYYFLRDGHSFLDWLLRLSPFPERDTRLLFDSIERTVNGALLGQIATSAVQGILTLVTLYACGIPGAPMLAILATLLTVVPLVGTAPVTIGSIIYLLAVGRIGTAVAMGVAAALIGLSDNVTRTLTQSSSTRMHPLVTFLSVFGGIVFMGGTGAVLGPVIAATALWAIKPWADRDKPHRATPAS